MWDQLTYEPAHRAMEPQTPKKKKRKEAVKKGKLFAVPGHSRAKIFGKGGVERVLR